LFHFINQITWIVEESIKSY